MYKLVNFSIATKFKIINIRSCHSIQKLDRLLVAITYFHHFYRLQQLLRGVICSEYLFFWQFFHIQVPFLYRKHRGIGPNALKMLKYMSKIFCAVNTADNTSLFMTLWRSSSITGSWSVQSYPPPFGRARSTIFTSSVPTHSSRGTSWRDVFPGSYLCQPPLPGRIPESETSTPQLPWTRPDLQTVEAFEEAKAFCNSVSESCKFPARKKQESLEVPRYDTGEVRNPGGWSRIERANCR